MFDTLLFIHFIGIAIGAGTGVYLMALSRHAAHNLDQAEARTIMPGIVNTISAIGKLGLVLLIISGITMALTMGKTVWTGLFMLKILLVLLLIGFIIVMNALARRANGKGDVAAALAMKRIAVVGPLLAVLTIYTAVQAFH